jgi:uncharacterized protein YdbL (DUF1318 family)
MRPKESAMSTSVFRLPTFTRAPRWLAANAALAALLLLGACVTINVYFPAAAAEKAADRIIDQVYGAPTKAPATGDKRTGLAPADAAGRAFRELAPVTGAVPSDARVAQTAFASQDDSVLLAAARAVLDFVVPAAHAQAPDLNVSTPAIRALVASMEARHAALAPHYASGAVGLTDDGMLEVRDQNAIPLAQRNDVRKLVADENSDRGNLYSEIAKANGNPGWAVDIRNTFARRWVEKAQPGWWFKQGGAWKQK